MSSNLFGNRNKNSQKSPRQTGKNTGLASSLFGSFKKKGGAFVSNKAAKMAAKNETKKNDPARTNKRIIHVLIITGLMFMAIIIYLTWFEMQGKDTIMTNSFNQRIWEREDDTLRGSIYDSNGIVLAYSSFMEDESGDKWQQRTYPYENLYSHVIGYNSKTYGKALLEKEYNDYLLNMDLPDPIADITSKISGKQKSGNNLYLTIDHQLQVLAGDLMKDYNGSVVALDPKTGAVLAMVSFPDYNPESSSLVDNWSVLIEEQDAPLFPRAFQGLYAPGSTFKSLTSIAAIDNGLADTVIEDEGSVVIDGKTFSNSGGISYGSLDLSSALTVSSNVYFSQLGVMLGTNNLNTLAETAGFGSEIPFDLPVYASQFNYNGMGDTDKAAVAIGQGKLLVTPLYMSMVAAAIANDGVMMQPYLVSKVTSPDDSTIWEHEATPWRTVTSAETADQVTDMMVRVVDSGTATKAQIYDVNVAGKTGTAENDLSETEENKEHAWFIAFAPAEDPQIAVAVILEYSGSTGGSIAAPIAGELMEYWLNNQ